MTLEGLGITPSWDQEGRVIAVILGAVAFSSVVRLVRMRWAAADKVAGRSARLGTWWVLAILLSIAVLLGPLGVCLLLAAASWLGYLEYSRMIATRDSDRLAARWVLATIPVTYLAIYLGHGVQVLPFIPVACLLLVAATEIWRGETEGYVRSTGGLVYGAVFLVFGLSHVAMLATLPAGSEPLAGRTGWVLYVILLTEMNDIFQALVGKQIGRHKITPRVSPNKTWEGFLGGAVVTLVLALVLAPLTPLSDRLAPSWIGPELLARMFWPLLAGLTIVVAGFLGDLNMSAVKRDAGVKDASTLLPGMGGTLDRVDSLTLSAPTFFYLIAEPAL